MSKFVRGIARWIAGVFALLLATLTFPAFAQVDPDAVTLFPQEGRQFYTELSPDDRTVAVWENEILLASDPAPEYRMIRLLDIETGEVRQLVGATDYTADVAFTSDGTIMASTHLNGDVNLWNVADGNLIKSIPLIFQVSLGQFLDDDQTLVLKTGGQFQQFLYLNTVSSTITRVIGRRFDRLADYRENYVRVPESLDFVYSAFAVTDAGDQLFAANANDDILLWTDDPTKPAVLHSASDEQAANFGIRSLAIVDDGRSVIYYDRGQNQLVRLGQTAAIPGGSAWFAAAPDGNRIAWVNTETNTVEVSAFDAPETIETLYTLPENLSARGTGVQMAFTSDGNRLVMGGFASSDLQNAIVVLDLSE